ERFECDADVAICKCKIRLKTNSSEKCNDGIAMASCFMQRDCLAVMKIGALRAEGYRLVVTKKSLFYSHLRFQNVSPVQIGVPVVRPD
ncbi:MAG: hypothetical protein EB015_21610, partial [Methylocystaceae bacterium]|nr:hypothetical protein [Methylocystaceae bacterium]